MKFPVFKEVVKFFGVCVYAGHEREYWTVRPRGQLVRCYSPRLTPMLITPQGMPGDVGPKGDKGVPGMQGLPGKTVRKIEATPSIINNDAIIAYYIGVHWSSWAPRTSRHTRRFGK